MAPDGSGVTPLGSGGSSPPSGDLAAVCGAGGAERLPQLPLYPACAQALSQTSSGFLLSAGMAVLQPPGLGTAGA